MKVNILDAELSEPFFHGKSVKAWATLIDRLKQALDGKQTEPIEDSASGDELNKIKTNARKEINAIKSMYSAVKQHGLDQTNFCTAYDEQVCF